VSQENVELVRRSFEAFNRRDLRALAELSDEDLEFVSVLSAVDAGGATYRGSEAWASYITDMDRTWEDWRAEDFRVFDADDDRVGAVLRLVGKGKHSGVPVEREVGLAYRIRAGKLWRMGAYLDPGDALKAVGLEE
jgi:ketosteroid isomerase-like protein